MPTPEALAWIRGRWIPALRSGEYEQGEGLLRRSESIFGKPLDRDQFCCLGVACDLAVKEGMISGWGKEYWKNTVGADGAYELLPKKMTEFLGMTRSGFSFDAFSDLADANDKGVPFDQIADALEAWCDRHNESQSA